jgi:hypothetical protein
MWLLIEKHRDTIFILIESFEETCSMVQFGHCYKKMPSSDICKE